ncbi:MAG: SPFH domain-containing protein [bacterium]|nr:SPFH domain-containing protein [bacterium]
MLSTVNLLIIIGVVVVLAALFIIALAKQYRKVGPNEVLIISGGRMRKVTDPDGTVRKIGYRMSVGGGTFVKPFIEQVQVLPLEIYTLNIKTPEVLTSQGVHIIAEATAQVKISSEENSVRQAAEQFLSSGGQGIKDVSYSVLEGYMRAVLGAMTVEEVYQNREQFSAKVIQNSQKDFARMGLEILSFALKDISDTQGYLAALGQPQIAQVKMNAAIAQAETDKEASIKAAQARKDGDIAKLKAEVEIARANRDFESQRAQFQADINQKRAVADFSYDLEKFRLSQQIKKEESQVKLIEKQQAIKIEELEILRKEKELDSSIKKAADAKKYQSQAEAEAESFRIEAEAKAKVEAQKLEGMAEAELIKAKGAAEAEAMKQKAESWKDYNEAAVYKMVIDALPELARAVSEPLSRIDKIVMVGGSDGSVGISKLTEQVAQVLAQLPTVVESLSGVDLKKLLEKLPGQKSENKSSKN